MLRQRLRDVLAKGSEINGFEIDQEFPEIGRRRLVVNARRIANTQTILIAIDDATDRMNAREELERSETAMRALLNSVAQAVITMKQDGTIVMVNGNTEKMFGYARPELVGQSADILIPDLRGRYNEYYKGFFSKAPSRAMGGELTLEGRARIARFFRWTSG